ncbi:hypothetical protein SPRG_10664 [Saprolegnia parasitica CBS 223.65]|uniref:Major facilitator superfamily (MFS) profile domain-containing protein n=2 Tax=Saprolegnia parasitica (strain CBS 223.65) TaxID=695850 RepID=A0A067CAW8_SAPPC|nr:hypothetical protein SPRG_10664 [Saprolegnia parasitica CBS 223.65]KDO23967.1 hypothetical protein SPRG_10664 [Saprolegnia parasitica CBS 223.65]|eukprot:XP_012205288.1 hypothetical protein SPRG_10664 [Saprolegnia parasitica CBS 223.65]
MLYSNAETNSWKFLKLIAVKENVTYINFIGFVLASGFAICMYVFLNASQGFVLGSILNVSSKNLGNITGNLTFFDQCISLVMVYVWGILSDRVGRNFIYGAGFGFMGLALILYPYATGVSTDLVLYRFVFALGTAATSCMLTAVLADYSAEGGRGKLSGLVGLMSGLGAIFAVFVFMPIPAKFRGSVEGIKYAFGLVGGISIGFGVLLIGMLWPKKVVLANSEALLSPANVEDAKQPKTVNVEKPSFRTCAKAGFAAAKDPKVLLAYIGSFLARGDTIIITAYLPLWIYKYYIENNLCAAKDANSPNFRKECRSAFITGAMVSGVVQVAALASAPIFGFLLDKVYRPFIVLLSALIGFVGYFWMFVSPDPTASNMLYIAAVVGVGEMGMIVSSLSLVTSRSIPAELRGSVSGAYSLCGTIGILITSKLGGYLFDVWTSTAPFFIMAIVNVLAAVIAIYVSIQDIKKTKEVSNEDGTTRTLRQVQFEEPELRLH